MRGGISEQVVKADHGSVAQSQKNAAENAAHQPGAECVEGAVVPQHHPFQSVRSTERRFRSAGALTLWILVESPF